MLTLIYSLDHLAVSLYIDSAETNASYHQIIALTSYTVFFHRLLILSVCLHYSR